MFVSELFVFLNFVVFVDEFHLELRVLGVEFVEFFMEFFQLVFE